MLRTPDYKSAHSPPRAGCRASLSPRIVAALAAWVAALVGSGLLSPTPVGAVIFSDTSDPLHNTTAPTGILANSGWDLQGSFGSVLGTSVSPDYFITAKHIKGTVGTKFTVGDVEYTTIGRVKSPSSDLRLWQVDGTFDNFATLYTREAEVLQTGPLIGAPLVVFGRGQHVRGEEVRAEGNPTPRGWQWKDAEGVIRWGRNRVSGIDLERGLLEVQFDEAGVEDEAHLSVGDSGGGLFIDDLGEWKLAGINRGVVGPFRTTEEGTPFSAAIFDMRGLYVGDSDPQFIVDQGFARPSHFTATRISSNADWINTTIDSTHRWSVEEPSASWGLADHWQAAATPPVNDWIATLANTSLATGQQALVGADSAVRQVNLFGTVGDMTLTLGPDVTLAVADLVDVNRRGIVQLQAGAVLASRVELAAGGTLQGAGTVLGDVVNSGTVASATTAGGLLVDGRFSQRAAGKLRILLEGIEPAQVGGLTVSGTASLAGTLEMSDTMGFETLPGDKFQVITYGEHVGQFTTISNDASPGLSFDQIYDDEAGTLLLSASGTFGDANLDGRVDSLDVDLLAAHWKQPPVLRGWRSGDFTGDGIVNIADLVLTAENWQFGVPPEAAAGPLDVQAFMQTVPEPNSAALLAIAILLLAARRRRARG